MISEKYKVLIVASHPVQYSSPIFRLMAKHERLDIKVAYCSMHGIESGFDAGFGVEFVWDIPLLDGYTWVAVKNDSSQPRLGKFWGLINIGIWEIINQNNFDAVIVFTGYTYATFWIAALATKLSKKAFVFNTDSSSLNPRNRSKVKLWLKKLLLPFIFSLADIVIVSSTIGKKVVASLGIAEQKITIAPFSVDNNWWISQANQVDVKKTRNQWNIPESSSVLLFCAKLQAWKRPQDALEAFSQANVQNSFLVFAGDGVMRKELESKSEALGIKDKVRFLGFVNQSKLPSVYRSANLFILPSEYEPFGVVVNEAMLCGCPAIVSDKVGAGYDLIRHGETGFVYPCGDIDALVKILQVNLSNVERSKAVGIAATERMRSWSPEENVEAIVQSLNTLSLKTIDNSPLTKAND